MGFNFLFALLLSLSFPLGRYTKIDIRDECSPWYKQALVDWAFTSPVLPFQWHGPYIVCVYGPILLCLINIIKVELSYLNNTVAMSWVCDSCQIKYQILNLNHVSFRDSGLVVSFSDTWSGVPSVIYCWTIKIIVFAPLSPSSTCHRLLLIISIVTVILIAKCVK